MKFLHKDIKQSIDIQTCFSLSSYYAYGFSIATWDEIKTCAESLATGYRTSAV